MKNSRPSLRAVCSYCKQRTAQIRRPSSLESFCRDCFCASLENEVHEAIIEQKLFKRGERVAVAISGGKDSTVLGALMTTLNKRHDYGLDLFFLAIDEGITGYRDDSLATVYRNEKQFGIPLHVASFKDLYGWRMDEIVAAVGRTNNCTYCGVLRRHALDKAATALGANRICTGHNADDCAETSLMNFLRGDLARFERSSGAITGPMSYLPRSKPLMRVYEKEIVLYAHFKELDYFSTDCTYSLLAYRGFSREFLKALERIDPQSISAILVSCAQLQLAVPANNTVPGVCGTCGQMASNTVCKACTLLQSLEKGCPSYGLVNRSKQKKLLLEMNN